MLERSIQALRTDDPADELPGGTRDRLKSRFAPGAVRRMTQLGMLIGSVLGDLEVGADDAVIYASQFGEGRALEAYLESFPTPSPTLFQTSIHPSGVQQGLIARQQPVREFLPMAGGGALVSQALLAALLSPAPRVVLCGGEERGTWLVAPEAASARTFAFALALTRSEPTGGIGRLRLIPDADVTPVGEPNGTLSLAVWFDVLHGRKSLARWIGPGWRLELVWT